MTASILRAGEPGAALEPVRAAEYLRMSTDGQQYSIGNQRAAIRQFASARGFEIVQSYVDEGKSGLTLDKRDALITLLTDVQTGRADYQVVLVYDVSRWGRFLDTDESGYYEYLCRRAHVRVEYCVEPFSNDGSPLAAILKAVKRAMAAEFSRELSVKVAFGMRRMSAMGYFAGGFAGYGLRRLILDKDGTPLRRLADGEQKLLRVGRTILVPGPKPEVATVRRIYRLFVEKKMFKKHIADLLTREGVPHLNHERWRQYHVHSVLSNERYVGTIVYNRTSSKLSKGQNELGRERNPPSQWVRGPMAGKPIVSRALFDAAHAIPNMRGFHYRDDEALLAPLRALLAKRGYLNYKLISSTKGMPAGYTYKRRFGSIREAYARIGYAQEQDPNGLPLNRFLRKTLFEIADDIVAAASMSAWTVSWHPRERTFAFEASFRLPLAVARYAPTPQNRPRWIARTNHRGSFDAHIFACMDSSNHYVSHYLLVRREDIRPFVMVFSETSAACHEIRCQSVAVLLEELKRLQEGRAGE